MNTAMSNRALMGAMPLLAQALGRKVGVKVVWGGNGPSTTGDTIYLPALPVDDEDTAGLVSGYIDHECGHVRASDFGVVRKAKTPLEKHTLNVLEDVRIEGIMGTLYPGCRTNLAVMVKKMVRLGDFAPVKEGNPASIVSGHLLYSLRARVLGQTGLDELAEDAAEKMDAAYPGLRAELDRDTAAVETAASTSDCLSIMRRVIETMKRYIKEPPQPPEQPQESPESPSSPSEGQDGPQQSGGGGKGDDKPQEGQQPGSQDQPAQDAQDGQGTGGDQGEKQDKPESAGNGGKGEEKNLPKPTDNGGWDQDQAKTLEKALSAAEPDLAKNLGEILQEKLEEKATAARLDIGTCGGIEPASHIDKIPLDEKKVSAETNALRIRLGSLLAATVQSRNHPSMRGRRLDNRMIVRLRAGVARNVFRGRNRKKGINTAVHILMDRSGSMKKESRMEVANDCMLAVKLALEHQRGVNLGISAFPTNIDGAGYVPILRHGEKIRSNEVGMEADGGTPLGEALWGVAVQMHPLPEERKVIVVLTDGSPHKGELVHRSLKSLKAAGFETVGIGIQSGAVADYFENHVVVNDVSELPHALFGQLEKLLTK